MKSLRIVALVLLAFAATAPAQDGKVQQEIKTIEEARNQAILSGDYAAFDQMTSDDYRFVTPRGEMRTKADIVSGFKSGTFKMARTTGDYWFTRVYARQNSRWVTVALQTTLIQTQ